MDQFKADLKGRASASTDLNLLRMLESRIIEIVQIESEVKKKYPKLFTQRLPRYMRRRAASHNPHRIPKWLNKFTSSLKMSAKDRSRLYKHRHRLRLRKHKRILRRHASHTSNPDKTIMHKWFAKRFKMTTSDQGGLEFVPLHNNTKNFRNLYRQSRYGCAYLSMAHLGAIQVKSPYNSATIAKLNTLTRSTAGFTFAARSIEEGRYEVLVHLYTRGEIGKSDEKARPTYSYLCPAFVTNKSGESFNLWIPRQNRGAVLDLLKTTGLPVVAIELRRATRVRLLGPEARNEAMRIASDKKKHEGAIVDVDRRLPPTRQFGISIGRHIEEKHASFTYYQTYPIAVDIVFRDMKAGRLLWHKMIRNKAHLVGGKRDVDELLKGRKCFSLEPDY